MRNRIEADVCVVGGGPAGSTAAIRLAGMGYRVCLLEKHRFPRRHIGESLVPSIAEIFRLIGVADVVEAAGFLRPRDMVVAWGGAPAPRSFAEAGYQVDRGRFDQILLTQAARIGVEVLQPAAAKEMVRREDGWTVRTRESDVSCGFVVDAAGRCGVLPSRKQALSAGTLALYAYWRPARAVDPATLVEAGTEEWFWGAPLPDGTFNATVFVDNADVRPVEQVYLDRLRRSELLAFCTMGERVSPVLVCDATCYRDNELVDTGWIKAGDAAFSIDPLSSQGVQVAMQSGLQAAVLIGRSFSDPHRAGEAARLYRAGVRRASEAHRNAAAGFYAQLQDRGEFWRRRA
ncbi:MAG: NAD(P)/FAD-dependent oxidoreductase [Bryobacteraceae bacterium]|nr:NAD(P)/FAD-dependent oxidoreductase [Bryobacteraceae bacterium]